MTHRIDAAEDAIQPPCRDFTLDLRVIEAEPAQLPSGDDPMLPCGRLPDHARRRGVPFGRYTVNKSHRLWIRPPSLRRFLGVTGNGSKGDLRIGRYEGPQQRLFAVRGATQATANDAEAILGATEALMRELIERNELEPADMVSCLFTTTDDLDAEFPAVAARKLGLEAVPLLCCREIPVPGSMPRVIRVMLHFYAPVGHDPAHVYIGEAQKLRTDLEAAQ